jgi:hypothetical protein
MGTLENTSNLQIREMFSGGQTVWIAESVAESEAASRDCVGWESAPQSNFCKIHGLNRRSNQEICGDALKQTNSTNWLCKLI